MVPDNSAQKFRPNSDQPLLAWAECAIKVTDSAFQAVHSKYEELIPPALREKRNGRNTARPVSYSLIPGRDRAENRAESWAELAGRNTGDSACPSATADGVPCQLPKGHTNPHQNFDEFVGWIDTLPALPEIRGEEGRGR